ncbi:MAG: hypothetical protein HQ559_07440 [Lentisphaerae bacterium]|nr:hypothetical protein [Lentisphaerota bacterium]
MRLPRNVVVLIVAVAVLAALAVAAYLLISGINRFGDIEREVQGSKGTLDGFYGQDPFPSQGNVSRERRNVELLKEWFSRTVGAMGKGQVESDEKSPSLFMGFLGEERARLEEDALAAGTGIPEDFAFGFGRYFQKEGELPAPDDVPRLTEQLQVIGDLCAVVYGAGVKTLSSIAREQFEGAPVAVRRRTPRPTRPGARPTRRMRTGSGGIQNPNAGLVDEGESYGKYHFVIECAVMEDGLWKLLNGFARHEMFVVPTGVWLKKAGEDVKMGEVLDRRPGALGREPEPDAAPRDDGFGTYRRQRLVSGPQLEVPMIVRIELDVYKFRKD